MMSFALQNVGAPSAVALLLVCLSPAATALPEQVGDDAPQALEVREEFHTTDSRVAELIRVMLEQNPEILAARAQWRSRLERVPQQRSLPDPQLSYRYNVETPETRVGPQRQGLEITQQLPWGGKRSEQAQRAEHTATRVAWNVRELERELVADLKRNYFEVAYLQQALAINAEEAALLRRYEQIALTRYSTGEGIQQSVIKVQTDLSRLVDQATALQARLDAASHHIVHLIGAPGGMLILDPIVLSLQQLDYDGANLVELTKRDHPSVRAVGQAIEADRAWLRRRRLESKPDFRVGLGYVEVGGREDAGGRTDPPGDNGKDAWSISVGVNLPIRRKRLRAGVVEAEESIRYHERLLDSRRNDVHFAVREALLSVESAEQRARLYEDVIVPQAKESLASAEAAYTTDRQGFLDLLDAQRVLLQVRLTYHRLVSDYWIALARLEHGLGRRFPEGGNIG